MKNLMSSDMNPMVLHMDNAAIRLATPVNTSALWGVHAVSGANSAVWGTSPAQGANWTPPSSAVWGTCAVQAPMQQMWAGRHSGIEWVN